MASKDKELSDKPRGDFVSPKPSEMNTSFSSAEKHRNSSAASSENDEYESEPASTREFESKKKKRMNFKDGKTVHPKLKSISRELRELAKKQIQLEKNLKIDGMPDPPKIRKRRMSVGANMGRERDTSFKRKRLNSLDLRPKKDHMPKWGLMGGDATDPLNLNGLATSEEGRLLNLRTPENSPLPTPDFRKIVYVKVPPNIEDPLNLEGKHDQRVIDMMLNATRKKRHRSKKNKDGMIQSKDSVNQSKEENPDDPKCLDQKETDAKVEPESENKPTPSVEDSGLNVVKPDNQSSAAARSRSISMSPDRKIKRQISGGKGGKNVPGVPRKFPDKPKFTQGNYNRYYGYRNQDHVPDPRLRYFNPQWFQNKDVLDIGCNVGHVTLALADQFSPRKILGMDIDGKLIGAARQNIRHLLSQRLKDSSNKYPSIFEATHGPLEAHPLSGSSSKFPSNVMFLQGNYVPGSEEILQLQKEECDTILALSITKWIHLNNGDRGLKLFFQKILKQLRPGGRLILEPQPWSTYRKRAKLSPELFKNYSEIKLKPERFKNYLLSIGFVKCEVIGVPVTKAKGFRRPLILFTKADPHSKTPQPSNATGSDFRPFAEQHAGWDLTGSDYIQCAGMRTGAYADRLYDHIAYRSSEPGRSLSVVSPMNFSNSNDAFTNRRDSPFYQRQWQCRPSSLIASSSSRASSYSYNSGSTPKTGSEPSPSSSFSGHGSQVHSGSDRSWTSDTSHSSSSSYSSASSRSTTDNGPINGNGEIPMEDAEWLDPNAPLIPLNDGGDANGEGGVHIMAPPLVNGHIGGVGDDVVMVNGHLGSSSSDDGNGDENNDPNDIDGQGVAVVAGNGLLNESSEGSFEVVANVAVGDGENVNQADNGDNDNNNDNGNVAQEGNGGDVDVANASIDEG